MVYSTRPFPMKKLLIVIVLLIGAVVAWRMFRRAPEPVRHTPAASTLPDAPKPIPQREAISGSTLNKAFPEAGDGYKLTFTQEKDGFAQAELSKGGAKAATLSISDTAANPAARDKFKTASRRIEGYPAAAGGSMGTAVLAERYQVQARSLAPAFTEADREAWLAKFKLAELAAIK